MPHPPGASASPPTPPAPRTVDSLPEMSKKHDIKANGSSEQKFKLEMTKRRHNYLREHLKDEESKRVETRRQRRGALKRLQERQAQDRSDNVNRLSFERLMQPNSELAASGPERQSQVVEFVKQRKIKRQENYRQAQEQASESRLDAMIRLYHASEDFVTMENLDAKVNEFYETGLTLQNKVYVHGVPDMVADVMENGGQVSYVNLLKREQELKDALEGTVAGGKVGSESVKTRTEAAAAAETAETA